MVRIPGTRAYLSSERRHTGHVCFAWRDVAGRNPDRVALEFSLCAARIHLPDRRRDGPHAVLYLLSDCFGRGTFGGPLAFPGSRGAAPRATRYGVVPAHARVGTGN